MVVEKIWTTVALHSEYGEDGKYLGTSVLSTGAFKSEEEAKKAGAEFMKHPAIAYIHEIWTGRESEGKEIEIEIRSHDPLMTEFAIDGVVTDMIRVDIREAELIIKKPS